jgi:hypothetical protein
MAASLLLGERQRAPIFLESRCVQRLISGFAWSAIMPSAGNATIGSG